MKILDHALNSDVVDPIPWLQLIVRAARVEREIGRKFCFEDSDSFYPCPLRLFCSKSFHEN